MVYLISPIRALRQWGQNGIYRANTDWGAARITVRHGDYSAKWLLPGLLTGDGQFPETPFS
jgi:hypothetical protein